MIPFIWLSQLHRDKVEWWFLGTRGGDNGEIVFNGYRVLGMWGRKTFHEWMVVMVAHWCECISATELCTWKWLWRHIVCSFSAVKKSNCYHSFTLLFLPHTFHLNILFSWSILREKKQSSVIQEYYLQGREIKNWLCPHPCFKNG